MIRVLLFLIGLLGPSLIWAQVIHPQSGIPLRYHRAQVNGNSILLSTHKPYLVELEASTLNPIRTIEIKGGFVPEEFFRWNDSILYAWNPRIGIPPNNSNVVLLSVDGGVNWRIDSNLRTTSGKLSFIDSNFIIDGSRFLSRYTLDGGQTYQSPSASNFELAGIHDSGAFLYQAYSDTLWNLTRTGMQLAGFLDTTFLSLRHLYRTSSRYFAISDSGALISLDTNFHFQAQLANLSITPFGQPQFFTSNDTLALVLGDSVYYSQNAGQAWLSAYLPSLVSNATFHCLALVNGELLFANGAGGLAGLSLKGGSSRFIGGNDYPLVNNLYPFSNGFYALGRNNVQLQGQPNFRIHRINKAGSLVRSTALPFLDLQVFPNMVVFDSLKIIIFGADSLHESRDGGLTWTAFPNQGILSTPIVQKAQNDSGVFLYEWDILGPYIAKLGSGGQRIKLNFFFGTAERALALCFWNSDSGLVFTNEDVYSTVDGGQSFNAWNQAPVSVWHTQWKSDTLLVASNDFNYRTKIGAGGLLALDPQPMYTASIPTYPYHFISEARVVSYIGGSSKIAIADSRYSYYQEFDLPVDQVNDFHRIDDQLYAITSGGGLLAFNLDSLFPADVSLEEFDGRTSTYYIWPNPVEDQFYIEGSPCDYFKIYNQFGQLIHHDQYDELGGARLSGLKPGIYYLQGFEANKLVFKGKFLYETN